MATVIGSATIRIIPDSSGFTAALQGQLRGLQGSVSGATGGLSGLNAQFSSLADNLSRAGTRMTQTGLAMTYGVTRPLMHLAEASIGAAAQFDEAIRTVAAVSEIDLNTAEGQAQIEAMTEAAREFGLQGKFSAIEVAQGFTDLARAGLDVQAIISTFPAVMNIATAEGIALADASDRLVQVFTGFGGTLTETGESIFGGLKEDMGGLTAEFQRFTDVLAKTSAATTTDIQGLTDAFRYAGPTASIAGLSFEETAASLGLLAQAGFQATVGGTALRGIITRLAIPTKMSEEIFTKFGLSVEEAFASADDVSLEDTRRELLSLVDAGQLTTEQMNEALAATGGTVEDLTETYNRLGLEVFDASGKMKPLADVIEELRVKGARVGDIMKLFGQRAGPGLLALMGQSPERLRELTAELELASGAAQKMADTIGESATIKFLMLKNALIDLAISIGESGLLDFFVDVADRLTQFVRGLSEGNPEIFKWVFAIGALVAAMGPVALGFGIITKSAAGVVRAIDFMRVAFLGAIPIQEQETTAKAQMAGAFRALLGPVGLVIAIFAALVGGLVLAYKNSEELRTAVSNLVDAFKNALGPVIERVKGWFEGAGEGADSLFKQIGDNLAPAVQGLADAVNDFVSSGKMDAVLDGIERAAKSLFEFLRDVGMPILQGLWELIVDLAPIVGSILAAAFQVAWAAADLFLDAIELILPALEPLAEFIGDNMIPVLIALGTAFLWVRGAAIATAAWASVSTAFAGVTAAINTVLLAFGKLSLAISLSGGGIQGLMAVIGGSVVGTAAVIAAAVLAVGVLIKTVYDRSEAFREAVSGAWENIQQIFAGVVETFQGLWNTIAGIFTLDGEQIVSGLKQVFDGLITGVVGGLSGLLAEVSRMLGSFLDTILEAFGNIPVIGPIFDLVRGVVNGLTSALAGLFDMLKGLLSLDMDMIIDGWNRMREALGAAWEVIENALGDIGSGFATFASNVPGWIGAAVDAIWQGLQAIPGLLAQLGGLIWEGLQQIPGLLGDLGAFLGPIIADAFGAAWGWLSNAAGAVGSAIWNFLTSTLPSAIGDALTFVFGQVLPAIGDFFSGLADRLPDIGETLRGWIVAGFQFLRDLPGIIWDAITGGGDAAAGAGDAIGQAVAPGPEQEQSLIARIGEFLLNAIKGAIEWLVTNLPTIAGTLLEGLKSLFTEVLPQAGSAIWNALVEYGPMIIEGLLSVIVGLGQFVGTLALELGKTLWTIITESVSLIGDIVGPVGGWLLERFGDVFRFVFDTLPSKISEFLDRLPDIVAGIFSAIADAISNAPDIIGNIASNLASFIGEAFSRVGEFIGEWAPRIGSALWDALVGAFNWLRENGPSMILNALKWIGIGIVAALVGIPYLIITEVIPRIVSAIGEFVPKAIEWLGANLPLILNWFMELPGRILGALGDVAGFLVNAFTEFGPRILEFLAGLPETIWNGAWALGEALVQFIIDAANGKFGGLLDLILSLPGQMLNLLGSIQGGLLEIGGAIIGLIVDGLSAAASGIWDFMQELPGILWDAFVGGLEWLIDKFFDAAEFIIFGFVDGLIAGFQLITQLPGMIWGWLQTLGPVLWNAFQTAVNFVFSLWSTAWQWLWDFFTSLPQTLWNMLVTLGSFLWTAFQAAVSFIQTAWPIAWQWLWDFFTALPGRIVSFLATAGEFIWNGIVAGWNWLRDQFATIFNAVVQFAQELPGRIVSFLATAGEFIWNAIVVSWDWLRQQFFNIIQAVLNFFAELPGRIVGFLITAGEFIWNGIVGTFSWLRDRFFDIVNAVWQFFVDLPGRIANALISAGQTIWNLISGTFNWLRDQITNVFQGVIDFIMNIPNAVSGFGRALVNVFRDPINWVLENVWQRFWGIVDGVASRFGIDLPDLGDIRIPVYHEGGIVGEGSPRRRNIGDSLMTNETLAVLKKGEAVIPDEVVANMSDSQLRALKEGDYKKALGDTSYNIGGFGIPNPFEAGYEFFSGVGGWVSDQARQGAAALLEAGYNNTIKPLLETFRGMFPGNPMAEIGYGMIDGVAQDILAWVRGASQADAEKEAASYGVPAGTFPPGFDIAGWRDTFNQWKGVQGSYGVLIQFLRAAGIPHLVNSTYRPGSITVSGNLSNHALNRAVDFGAPNDANYDSPGLLRINQAFWPFIGTLAELIYSGPGGKSDKNYGAAVMAGHHNHVHVALGNGAIINDAISAILGESGPEVVIPLNNPVRALQLARSSGLFAVLAAAAAQSPSQAGIQTTLPATSSAAPGEAGFLGGGPGNTYNIYGVTMDQVRAEIAARDEAAMRGRR